MGLLSAIGGAIGLAVGGPLGSAIGSGLGSLAGGGDFGDALKSGILGYGIGSIPGAQGMVNNVAGSMISGMSAGGGSGLSGMFGQMAGGGFNPAASAGAGAGMAGGAGGAVAQGAAQAAGGGGIGNLLGNLANSPLVMATLMEAAQPRGPIMSDLQQRQAATGERLPDYRGTPAPDYRYGGSYPVASRPVIQRAMGGMIEGPGTGTSDSIPAMIYQNGGPVQEARLSDGEFVMTADAVRGAGNGDRAKGAAKMYEMMSRLERRA